MTPVFTCPGCSHRIFPSTRLPHYGRCQPCGVWIRIPPPSDAELTAIYGSGYYASWGSGVGGDGYPIYWNLKRTLFRRLLAQAGPFSPGGAALDVGCATGACLSVLRDLGLRAHGIDVNEHAVTIARRLVPEAEIHAGWLEEAPLAPASFDLVVLSDVIEHARDPWAFMGRITELLRPGGRVVILTPDMGSLLAKAMGRAWPHLKPEHLFLFDRRGLSRLFDRHGLRLRRLSSAPKPLSLDYAVRQFDAYPLPGVTPLLRGLRRLVPFRLAHQSIALPMGEMLAVAEKL